MSQILQKSKFNRILDFTIIVLFSLTFFSIPAFSFLGGGKYVTWSLTSVLLVCILIDLSLFYGFKIDYIFASLVLFGISAFMSSLFNGFKSFKGTPILLSLLSAFIYLFCVSSKKRFRIETLIFACYFGSVLFLGLFIIKYFNELKSLDFDRLGSKFGDDNDIALFHGFGLICSIYYALRFRKRYFLLNIISFVLSLLFVFCGFSTGSKIFVLILLFSIIFYPFAICGKRRWWVALLVICGLAGLLVIFINLPIFSTVKSRFLSFISTLIGKSIGNETTNELSTINRFDMFLCGMQMWLRKPMFGWGIWGFATFSGRAGGWSHNNISESFCNFGLVGTFLFHFGLAIGIKDYIKGKNKKSLTLPFSLLAFYLISMLSVALNSQKIYAYVIGIVLSILCSCEPILTINAFYSKNTKEGITNMKRITIIGNNANNSSISDGGRIKIRLFKTLLERENYRVNIIELDGWKRHIFRLIVNIYNSIVDQEPIVIMAGPKGSRFIIPIVNFFNRNKKTRVVFCALGIGTLDAVIKKMSQEDAQAFLKQEKSNFDDKKMEKNLKKLDCVILENKTLNNKYQAFYHLSNTFVLNNFRDIEISPKIYDKSNNCLSVVYFSRVKNNKGVFDLINDINDINSKGEIRITLDIYGDNQLSEEENAAFSLSLNKYVNYKGVIDASCAISTLKKYDLFCLPTKYYGEGTSGALIEAMISGLPPLVSNYSQARDLVSDKETGFIYAFNSANDLKNKLLYIATNKGLLENIGKNAQIFASQYTYSFNRERFIYLLTGDTLE